MNLDAFVTYVEQVLVPELRPVDQIGNRVQGR